MASSSRNVPLEPLVDEFYFSALFDDEEIFPISDEKYAQELTLQEALMAAIQARISPLTPKVEVKEEHNLVVPEFFNKGKRVKLETGCQNDEPGIFVNKTTTTDFCAICMDAKPSGEMFRNDNCSHVFCSACIASHVAAKIQDNIAAVECPEPGCVAVLDPQRLGSVVPRPKKLYFPFEDFSAMTVVGDGGEASENNDEAEKLVIELAEKNNWRRCPGCKFYVEKNEGCFHISCRCGNEFCYNCGSKWSSGHAC